MHAVKSIFSVQIQMYNLINVVFLTKFINYLNNKLYTTVDIGNWWVIQILVKMHWNCLPFW